MKGAGKALLGLVLLGLLVGSGVLVCSAAVVTSTEWVTYDGLKSSWRENTNWGGGNGGGYIESQTTGLPLYPTGVLVYGKGATASSRYEVNSMVTHRGITLYGEFIMVDFDTNATLPVLQQPEFRMGQWSYKNATYGYWSELYFNPLGSGGNYWRINTNSGSVWFSNKNINDGAYHWVAIAQDYTTKKFIGVYVDSTFYDLSAYSMKIVAEPITSGKLQCYTVCFNNNAYFKKNQNITIAGGQCVYASSVANLKTFKWDTFYLTVQASVGPGSTTPSAGVSARRYSDTVSITATTGSLNVLSGWLVNGTAAGQTNPLTLVIGGNTTVRATFASEKTITNNAIAENYYTGASILSLCIIVLAIVALVAMIQTGEISTTVIFVILTFSTLSIISVYVFAAILAAFP